VRTCERNNSVVTKVSAEGGEGGALVARAEIHLQPVEKTMVSQAVPLQPMEVHAGADIHLQTMEGPTPEQVDAPGGGCDPVESPCWSRLLQDLWTRGERSPRWSRFAGRACDPVGDPRCS